MSLELAGQIRKALRNDIEAFQYAPCLCRDSWRDCNEIDPPTFKAAMGGDEAIGILLQRDHVSRQPFRRSFARPETQSAMLFSYRHQVDLHIAPIPIAAYALREREVTNTAPASLLIHLAGQIFQRVALDIRQPLVRLRDERLQRPECNSRDRPLQRREPGAQEIVAELVPAAARLGRREDGQSALDHAVALGENFQVAANLPDFTGV